MITVTRVPKATFPGGETIGIGNVITSEWTKLRSLRSSFWTGILAVVGAILIAILGAISFVRNVRPDNFIGFDAANLASKGCTCRKFCSARWGC